MENNTRMGETRTMNCGMKATVIEYRSCMNIDIQFEDGAIKKNCTYGNFKEGKISHPHGIYSKTKIARSKKIGEIHAMNCGMKATIIAYRSYRDIDVQFEDGTIRKNCYYACFQNGKIAHPDNAHLCVKKARSIRIGETLTMNCGMKATIIAYRSSKDIDVQFEDGTIQKNCVYNNFKRRSISNLYHSYTTGENALQERLGETRTMKCGMKATIINYVNSQNIDIQFEDGVVRKNCKYHKFAAGTLMHPSSAFDKDPNSKIGENRTMNNGLEATIIAYRNNRDVDIKFEDGSIKEHVRYEYFKKGSVRP